MQFINLVHVQRARRALLQLAQGAKGRRQLVRILLARGTLHPGVEIKAEATHLGGLQMQSTSWSHIPAIAKATTGA